MSGQRSVSPAALSREHLGLLRRVAEILTAMPYEAGRVRALETIQRAVFAGGARAGAVLEQANLGALAHTLVYATATLRATDRPGEAEQAAILEKARRLLNRLERAAQLQRPLP